MKVFQSGIQKMVKNYSIFMFFKKHLKKGLIVGLYFKEIKIVHPTRFLFCFPITQNNTI